MAERNIDHKQLLAMLSDEDRLALTSKSDLPGLLKLFGHIVALSITGCWITYGLAGWQIAMIAHGVMIVFLFTLLHETVHFTPFKSVFAWQSSQLRTAVSDVSTAKHPPSSNRPKM